MLIAGAGLAGLSAARELLPGDFLLCEAAEAPGGLCRSFEEGGYTFDHTGHLLHLSGKNLRLVEGLLGENLAVLERRARVFSRGVTFDYPFQVHFHALPGEAARECMEGLKAVQGKPVDRTNFETWCRTVFGEGIYRHFMKPYNEKLYRTSLSDLTADWVGWIPRPPIDVVEAAARGDPPKGIGYNAVFRYPKRGGIGALPKALAANLPIRLRTALVAVRGAARTAVLRDETGATHEVRYERLISSIPLPNLVGMLEDAPDEVREAACALEAVDVVCLNLGVDGPTSDAHWIYYPDPEVVFYRVGFYHNLSPNAAPQGKSALYVEMSERRPGDLPDDYRDRAIRDLVAVGLIDDPARVEVCRELRLKAAYGLYTPARARALAVLRPYLTEIGIVPVGRYGRWAYTSMGEALAEGRAAGRDAARGRK